MPKTMILTVEVKILPFYSVLAGLYNDLII